MQIHLTHKIILGSLIALLFSFEVFAQESGIKLVVQVKHQGKSYADANIEIKKDQSFYDKTGVTEGGEFSYIFGYGAVYHIYFSGEGMATKSLEIDLKETPAHEKGILHDWELGELSLFKTYDGVDLSVLEKPVGRIHYDDNISDFTIDYKYGASVEKQMDKLHSIVEEAQKVEAIALKDLDKTYDDFVKRGDESFKQNDFDNALIFYKKAASLIPENTKAPEKIEETLVEIENEARYKDLVLAGDEFYQKEEWVLAKDQYLQAKELKPSASYPKSQLASIAQKVEQQELLSNQFNNHMAVADVAFTNGNFVAAAEAYKKALAINPEAAMAKNRLGKSETEISKQDAATNRIQKSQSLLNEATRAELAGDYIGAKQLLENALVMDPTNEELILEKKKVDEKLLADKKKQEAEEQAKIDAELLEAQKIQAKLDEFDSWKKKGMAADQAGKAESAIYYFNKALEINPDDNFINNRVRTLKEGKSNSTANKPNKSDKKKSENEFQALDDMDKKSDNFVALLAVKYPQGMTENTYQEGNKKVTKRIVVKGNLGTEYMKVEHSWGGVYYFKNGDAITEYVWQKEAK